MPSPLETVWFYNSISGAVISEPRFGDTIQAHLPGWHGPFNTKQQALDFYASGKAANPGWKAPAGFGANITNTVGAGAGAAVNAVVPTVGGFLGRLQNGHLWQRVAEVVIGGTLLIVAVKGMLPAGVQQGAKKVAKTVGWFA